MKTHLLLLLVVVVVGATVAIASDNGETGSPQLISEKLRRAVPADLNVIKHELQELKYRTQFDHFDPRNNATVEFVSKLLA